MKTSRLMLLVLPVAAAAMIAGAQTRPAGNVEVEVTDATTRPATVVRLYEVADLVMRPNDYPAANPQNGGVLGGNGPSPSESAANEGIEWLTRLFESLVASDSWRANGGLLGAIQVDPIKATLIIEQTPANHGSIARLLSDLRARPAARTMVTTRATWLLIDDKDVRAMQSQARLSPPPGATSGPLVVDDATLDRAESYAAAQTTCFDGQTVSLASQRSWSVVTDVNPVVGTGAVGYDPTTDRATSGATLQITPRLTPDGAVIVDVHSIVTETKVPAARPTTTPPPSPQAEFDKTMIDPLDVATQQIATTTRLPLGKRVIVAGTTLPPSSAGERVGRTLYLVLEVDAVR